MEAVEPSQQKEEEEEEEDRLDVLEKVSKSKDAATRRHQRRLAICHQVQDRRRETIMIAIEQLQNNPWVFLNLYRVILLYSMAVIRCFYYPFSEIERDLSWMKHCWESSKCGKQSISWNSFEKSERQKQKPITSLWVFRFSVTLILVHLTDLYLSVGEYEKHRVLITLGSRYGEKIFKRCEWYRLVTSALLHIDFGHLFTNICSLLVRGIPLERRHGSRKVTVVVVLSQVATALPLAWTFPSQWSVGASIMGYALHGMFLADVLVNWDVLLLEKETAVVKHKIWCLFNVLLWGLVEPVGELLTGGLNHVGGFFFGFCISLILRNHILSNSGILCESGKPYLWYMRWAFFWCLTLGLAIPLAQILKPIIGWLKE